MRYSLIGEATQTVAYFPESKLLLCGILMEIYGNKQCRRAVRFCP